MNFLHEFPQMKILSLTSSHVTEFCGVTVSGSEPACKVPPERPLRQRADDHRAYPHLSRMRACGHHARIYRAVAQSTSTRTGRPRSPIPRSSSWRFKYGTDWPRRACVLRIYHRSSRAAALNSGSTSSGWTPLYQKPRQIESPAMEASRRSVGPRFKEGDDIVGPVA